MIQIWNSIKAETSDLFKHENLHLVNTASDVSTGFCFILFRIYNSMLSFRCAMETSYEFTVIQHCPVRI